MKNLSIASFNVCGLVQESKQEQLAVAAKRYGVDIICLQETKIKDGIDRNVDQNYRLISLPTDQRAYGNGFLVSSRIKIHRYWRISDRISILQVHLNPDKDTNNISQSNGSIIPSKCKQVLNTNITIGNSDQSPKHIATFINVYAQQPNA